MTIKKITTMSFLASMRLSTAFILIDFFYTLFARYFDGIICRVQLYLVLIDSRDLLPEIEIYFEHVNMVGMNRRSKLFLFTFLSHFIIEQSCMQQA
jgi:hypothetical protein